jgi:hypothetical protein
MAQGGHEDHRDLRSHFVALGVRTEQPIVLPEQRLGRDRCGHRQYRRAIQTLTALRGSP